MSTEKKPSKLQLLAEIEGFDDPIDMVRNYHNDSVVPGICMNEGCDATYMYEPDSTSGWCDECETNSVKSCLVLMGVI